MVCTMQILGAVPCILPLPMFSCTPVDYSPHKKKVHIGPSSLSPLPAQCIGCGHEHQNQSKINNSAHTALAVKACLLGGNSYTKCSITFVNIAVAISALAGGGPKTVSHRDQTPKTVSHRDQNTVVFSTFFEDFWVSERKRVLKWNFGSFW